MSMASSSSYVLAGERQVCSIINRKDMFCDSWKPTATIFSLRGHAVYLESECMNKRDGPVMPSAGGELEDPIRITNS